MLQSVTTIQGERVLLRPYQEGDAEESARVWTPELRYMYGGSRIAPRRPAVASQPAAKATVDENEHQFSIEADGRYIGFVGLRPNDEERSGRYRIGIANPEYWGKGYGSEVTRLMLRYAFETLDLHRVSLRVAAYNTRARRCYEKCGFRVEGVERQSFQVDGEWQDDVLMAILQEEWERRTGAPEYRADGIAIRSYRASDYQQVRALWSEADISLGPSDTAAAIALLLALDRAVFFVAEAAGAVVGTAMGNVERASAWVRRVAVHPRFRRQGIARRLMIETEQALAALGAARLNLLTHEENAAAQSLYRSLGYQAYPQILYMNKDMGAEDSGSPGDEENHDE